MKRVGERAPDQWEDTEKVPKWKDRVGNEWELTWEDIGKAPKWTDQMDDWELRWEGTGKLRGMDIPDRALGSQGERNPQEKKLHSALLRPPHPNRGSFVPWEQLWEQEREWEPSPAWKVGRDKDLGIENCDGALEEDLLVV